MESTVGRVREGSGTITGGSYRFLLPLAEGGMGRVDVVVRHDGSFRRLYALKRLHMQYRSDPAFRGMFLDEARIAGLLRHPNAVSVLDVGEDDGGPYLVMDYVDGVPLSAVLRHLRETGERLPMQLAIDVVAQAALGLDAAHELRNYDGSALELVHRDVSPQNILVSFNGVVQMTDFGVAKALGRLTETQSGVLKGKYGYMSPEQLRFRDIDRRSDIFALGVVLFELIAGRRLYGKGEVPAPRRILEDPPPDIGEEREDLMPELVELCFELLAKEPDARPATAKEVAERLSEIGRALALEEGKLHLGEYITERFAHRRAAMASRIEATFAALEPVLPPTNGVADVRTERPASTRRTWVGLVAVSALALGGLVAVGLTNSAPDAEPARPAARASTEPDRGEESPPVTGTPDGVEIEASATRASVRSPAATPSEATPSEARPAVATPGVASPATPEAPSTTSARRPRRRPRARRPAPTPSPDRARSPAGRPVWGWPEDE